MQRLLVLIGESKLRYINGLATHPSPFLMRATIVIKIKVYVNE